jgi:hypothetical protein
MGCNKLGVGSGEFFFEDDEVLRMFLICKVLLISFSTVHRDTQLTLASSNAAAYFSSC